MKLEMAGMRGVGMTGVENIELSSASFPGSHREKPFVGFTVVRVESRLYPGCVSITFHHRSSEAQAVDKL